MKDITGKIIGTGSYLPKREVTNHELFKPCQHAYPFEDKRKSLLGMGEIVGAEDFSDKEVFLKYIEKSTGILKRRFYSGELDHHGIYGKKTDCSGPSGYMALEASLRALDSAKIRPKDLDFIVSASATPTDSAPPMFAYLAGKLGVEVGGDSMDAACAGFVQALMRANEGIQAGKYGTVLVVASDTMSSKIDYDDSNAFALLGDAAGAVVLQRSDRGIINTYSRVVWNPGCAELKHGGKFSMNGGKRVMREGIRKMQEASFAVLKESNLLSKEGHILDAALPIIKVIPHQANNRMLEPLLAKLGVPEENFCNMIRYVGNTSSAAIPLALDLAAKGVLKDFMQGEEEKIREEYESPIATKETFSSFCLKEKDIVLMPTVGIGFVYGAAILDWFNP